MTERNDGTSPPPPPTPSTPTTFNSGESKTPADDRRASLRLAASYPAKVYDHRAEKYFPAETCNLSETGALLKIQRSMPVMTGDVFDMAVAQSTPSVVIKKESMVTVRVVRVIAIDHFSQAVAVEYHQMPAIVSTPETTEGRATGDKRRAA